MQQVPGGLLTFGIEVTRNTSDGKLKIEDLRLTGAKGIAVVGAKVMLVPDSDDETIGARNGWPPRIDADETALQAAFDRAPVADGAVVPADKSQTVSFVVGVKTKAGGRSGPLQVRYEDAKGDEFTWRGTASYRTSAGACGG